MNLTDKMKKWLDLARCIEFDEKMEKIKNKKELSNKEKINLLSRFSMLYMLFNEIFKNFKGNRIGERDRTSERGKIKKFVGCNEKNLEKLKETKYFDLLKEELERKELENLKKGSDEKIQATEIEDLKNLFTAIYIIRCNLFHGDKIGRFDHRDIKLIYCAQGLLDEMFKILEKEGYYGKNSQRT
jgi:hypothetical protein